MPAVTETRARQRKPGTEFVRLVDRGIGRRATEAALRGMIARTHNGDIPQVIQDSNLTTEQFQERVTLFNALLEHGIVRVGPSHVPLKDQDQGFGMRLVRAKRPYILLNLDLVVADAEMDRTTHVVEDGPIGKIYEEVEERADHILAASILTVTHFYEHLPKVPQSEQNA